MSFFKQNLWHVAEETVYNGSLCWLWRLYFCLWLVGCFFFFFSDAFPLLKWTDWVLLKQWCVEMKLVENQHQDIAAPILVLWVYFGVWKELPVIQHYGDRQLGGTSWVGGRHNWVVSVRTLFLIDSLQIGPFHYISRSSEYTAAVLPPSVLRGGSQTWRCSRPVGTTGSRPALPPPLRPGGVRAGLCLLSWLSVLPCGSPPWAGTWGASKGEGGAWPANGHLPHKMACYHRRGGG